MHRGIGRDVVGKIGCRTGSVSHRAARPVGRSAPKPAADGVGPDSAGSPGAQAKETERRKQYTEDVETPGVVSKPIHRPGQSTGYFPVWRRLGPFSLVGINIIAMNELDVKVEVKMVANMTTVDGGWCYTSPGSRRRRPINIG